MKAEFLQNFKVGDASLPKEVIDAIQDRADGPIEGPRTIKSCTGARCACAGSSENDRDIEAAKKPFADYDAIKDQLRTATDSLKALEGVDVKDLQGQIAKLTKDLADKETEHQARLAEMEFDGALKDAITAAKGRSVKAIRAELDVDALRASKNRETDIKAALEGLKQSSGYLFESGETPPPYAAGTGTQAPPSGSTFNFGFTGVRAPAAPAK